VKGGVILEPTPESTSRREFLKRMGAWTLAAAGSLLWLTDPARAAAAPRVLPAPKPALPLADRHIRQTLAAFADTIIPGPEHDPDGTPGAVQARAVELFHDPYYGVDKLLPGFVAELDRLALERYQSTFVALTFAKRTDVVLGMQNSPVVEPLLLLVMVLIPSLAFYAGPLSDVGIAYIQWGGPAHEYKNVTYGRPLARTRTRNGNMD
jgi:hypothetical protein